MKVNYILLISLLIVGLLCVPAVSANEVLYDEQLYETFDTSKSGTISDVEPTSGGYQNSYNSIAFRDITLFRELYYLDYVLPGNHGHYADNGNYLENGRHEFDYTFNGASRSGVLYVSRGSDILGQITSTKYTIFLNDWDIGDLSGTQFVNLPFNFRTTTIHGTTADRFWGSTTQTDAALTLGNSYVGSFSGFTYQAAHASGLPWKNHLTVKNTTDEIYGYDIELLRTVDGIPYTSTISVYNSDDLVFSNNAHGTEVSLWYPQTAIDRIMVTSPSDKDYTYVLDGGDTDDPTDPTDPTDPSTYSVTVYAQNGDTGALIADTNLNVNLYETETWYNSTLEWGWDTIQLPAGNYEFYAEKSGFTQYAPGRLTVDGVGDNINLLLYPDVVAPTAGNLTLQFWVCDSNSNGIPYAELSVIGLVGEGADYDSGIIQTNNLGYATLAAPGNSTYTAYASKPGYTAGENEFGVTTVSPVHIAVMLMAGEIPTNPTPTQPGITPTVTPTVRPTDVAPGNNPIDNFRIMFLNMGFDDIYSDWLTGLFIICIGAALGYGVAKKFGAMCGAPIGLVTATGLGLIPIWALVLIIVIVALAYAKFIMGR